MKRVVFVAPYFGGTMVRCLGALAELEDVQLGVVTHESEGSVPPPLRGKLAHYRVDDALDAGVLIKAGEAFQKEWGGVDRLLGYLEQLQLPLAQARDALGIAGMSAQVAQNFRDKHQMKAVLGEAGLPVARQRRVEGAADARGFVAEVGYPVILKPVDGLGTKDTLRVNDDDELGAALNRLLPRPGRPAQCEEFVTGEEHTLEAVSIGGKVVWRSSTYYLPGPLHVLENPWIQYCVLLPREQARAHVEAFAATHDRAVAALGMETGLSHMEWFLQQGGRAVISEVGARPPGVNIMDLNGLAHGVDFWAKWARLMVHETWDVPERAFATGSAFFRGQGAGRVVAAVHGVDEVRAKLGDTLVAARFPKVGQPRSTHYEGEGFAIVRHPETEGAIQALRTLVTTLKIHYR